MRQYETPLSDRIRMAENSRACYRKNPEYRLKAINRDRRRRGLPTLASLEQAAVRI